MGRRDPAPRAGGNGVTGNKGFATSGLGPLASISHDVGVIVCEGDTAVTEHIEHWEWPSGERASLPFVSVQQVRDGKFVRWWDYWDLGALMNHAPAWWVEHIMVGYK